MTARRTAPVLALVTLLITSVAPALAQEPRFRVSFAPAAATTSGETELALGGSFGYRFSQHFWFEGNLTWFDAPEPAYDPRILQSDPFGARFQNLFGQDLARLVQRGGRSILPSYTAFPLVVPTDGHTLVGTIGLRYELPVQTDRFRPYLAGGLGINRTEHEFELDGAAFADRFDDSLSHTGLAFQAGLGASVRLFHQFYGDVDARYFRLSRERNLVRLGGGVSMRF